MKDWVSAIFKRYNLEEEFSDQLALVLWPEVVGPQLSRMTRAVMLVNGKLTVETISSTVSQELDLLQQRYIDELNARMEREVVKRIRFVPGRFRIPRTVKHDLDDVFDETVPDMDIDDPQLREDFISLYRAQTERERAMLEAGARRCPRCGVVFFGDSEICPGCQFDEIDER